MKKWRELDVLIIDEVTRNLACVAGYLYVIGSLIWKVGVDSKLRRGFINVFSM